MIKASKVLFAFALCLTLVSCGGNKKSKNGEITGKWQPQRLTAEVKGMAKMMTDQLDLSDITDSLLDDEHKTGWIEFREDGTFTMRETAEGSDWIGTWKYDGQKITVSNDSATLDFAVESLSPTHMEVDFASVHKMAAEGEGIPFFSGIKMVMTYKRIE